MSVREYVGARYVPKFMGEYSPTTQYEPLCIVDDGLGTSYTSKKTVPPGTPLNNTEYWAMTGSTSGAIIHLQDQINDLNDEMTEIHECFVTPEMFGAVADGVTDNTQAVQDAIDTGVPVYIKKDILYNKNNLALPHDAIIYDEHDGGYIRIISNGYEGGAVNEIVYEACYHPAIMLDVNDQLQSDTPIPEQNETLAAVGFRHNGNGKWALRADFGEDQFRIEHYDSYYQPILIKPNAVIINNRDFIGPADNHGHTLFIKGNMALEGANADYIGFRIVDSNDNLLKFAQIGFDNKGFGLYDSTNSPPYKFAHIAYNGVAAFNTVSVHYHTTAQIKSFSPDDFEIGTICLDITLGRPVILRSKNPMTWIDFAGTTVYTGNQ